MSLTMVLFICLHFWLFGSLLANSPSQYTIRKGDIPSYLHGSYTAIDEELFPAEIFINVTLTYMAGTLLYSVYPNGNELTVSLTSGQKNFFTVLFKGSEKDLQADSLCGCSPCLFRPLLLFISISDALYIRCNGNNRQSIPFSPVKNGRRQHSPTKNSAKLWLFNVPETNNSKSSVVQAMGCLFNFSVKGQITTLKHFGNAIIRGCKTACFSGICGNGKCYETFDENPKCDCTRAFGNGGRCEDKSRNINKRYSMEMQFVMVKVSWKYSQKVEWKVGTKTLSLTVKNEGNALVLIQRCQNQQEDKKDVITTDYSGTASYALVMNLKRNISVQLFQGRHVDETSIAACSDWKLEVFEYLQLSSGTGHIDMAYKISESDVEWTRQEVDEQAAQDLPPSDPTGFYIKKSPDSSYLEARFQSVKEDIFPNELKLTVSFTKAVGTLLHSTDANGNNLTIAMSNEDNPSFLVSIGGTSNIEFPMSTFCGCKICEFQPLVISVRITTDLHIQCNNENVRTIKVIATHTAKLTERNSATLWLVNKPKPDSMQLQGCIHNVTYKGELVYLKAFGNAITVGCNEVCTVDACNQGKCYETFESTPLCDCSYSYGSGDRCADESRQINKRYNQNFQFSIIKLSWTSDSQIIWQLGNSNVELTLKQDLNSLWLIIRFVTSRKDAKCKVVHYYKENNQYNLIMTFGKETKIQINRTTISCDGEVDVRAEVFEYLVLSSGNGNIDMVFKDKNSDVAWVRWAFDEANAVNMNVPKNSVTGFNIKRGHIPSYLEKTFSSISEDVFPRSIKIAMMLNNLDGVLLYSIDTNKNQIIIKILGGSNPFFLVSFQGVESTVPMDSLCSCNPCTYQLLNFSMTVSLSLTLQCNGGANYTIMNNRSKTFNDRHPLVPLSSNGGSNEGRLWLVNIPTIGNTEESYPEQLQGCLFSVEYNGQPINDMKAVGAAIAKGCSKVCHSNTCNDGRCFETYTDPLCDCTKSFGSGKKCNDESRKIDKTFNQQFQFWKLKFSWRTNRHDVSSLLWVAGNKNVILSLTTSGNALYLKTNITVSKSVTEDIIIDEYVWNREYVLVMTLGRRITVEVTNGKSITINCPTDISTEIWEYMNISSGSSEIGIAYKTGPLKIQWETLDMELNEKENDNNRGPPSDEKPSQVTPNVCPNNCQSSERKASVFKVVVYVFVPIAVIVFLIMVIIFVQNIKAFEKSDKPISRETALRKVFSGKYMALINKDSDNVPA